MSAEGLVVRPVTTDLLPDVASLFGGYRNTRHCWCMAFCSSPTRFALGWFGGGNRRDFEQRVSGGDVPMGVLASRDDGPVGWCACGPRARYAGPPGRRNPLLRAVEPDSDDAAWLAPCLYVREEARGGGVAHALVRAAVELARAHGARAVQGWPLAAGSAAQGEEHVGRQELFEELGFAVEAQAGPGRVLVRLELP